MILSLVFSLAGLQAPVVPPSRFQSSSVLPLPAITIDQVMQQDLGVATEVARANGLQARVLWIDATANLDKLNTEAKIKVLFDKIQLSGFNTVVLDVKPISGQTLFPSKIAPRLLEWRGKTMPVEFDPVKVAVEEAHIRQLSIFCSLNAFSEGHNLLKVGPGYAKPDLQSILYLADPVVQASNGLRYPVAFAGESNGSAEIKLFRDAKQIPAPSADAFVVTVQRTKMVQDGFEGAGYKDIPVAIPNGGYALYAAGAGAEFLRKNLLPGTKVSLATEAKFVRSGEKPDDQYPLMMNPNSLEVQDYELSVLRELVTNYPVDGVLYDDRFRYSGIHADFSPTSRRLFEASVGKQLKWPDDIFSFTVGGSQGRGILCGPYYDAWMSWRSMQLRKYLNRVREVVHLARPTTQVGLYAGSWFGEYPALGPNWGATNFDAGFWFLTPEYKKGGLAPMLDFLMTGCYYPTATIYDSLANGIGIGSNVEAAGILTNRAVRDQTWCYAGIALSQFKGNPEGLADALQAACATTQGVMVFDLSHDIEPMWSVFAQAFKFPAKAPHGDPKLLTEVRRRRASLDAKKKPNPTVILTAGSSGTGQ